MAGTAKARRAFAARVRRTESRETKLTPSQGNLSAAGPLAYPAPMARLRRSMTVPPPLYGGSAQGNAAVTSDERGQQVAQPGKGPGPPVLNTSPFPQRQVRTPQSQLGLAARTPAFQGGRMTARDRRVAAYRGHVTLSGQRDTKPGGYPDPDADGPARPAFLMVNRTLSWQLGADATANLDNPAPKPVTAAGGRAFPLGTQGDPWSVVYGGTRGLADHRPYGRRGGPQGGIEPRVLALPGGPRRPGTVLAEGSPQDGPQKIRGGPPWGLHSPTVPPVELSQGAARARFRQVKPPRANRPLNSRTAGQSWDQGMVRQDGTQAMRIPRTRPGRGPGVNARFRRTR